MDRTHTNEMALRLSALMDGELGAAEADTACAAWGREADQRGTWHAYHVIGDVLRSEELGCAAQDEAFLQRLRGRLEREPVVFAPQALVADDVAVGLPAAVGMTAAEGARSAAAGGVQSARRRLRWMAPVGAAAGVAAVAVAAFLMQRQDAGAGAEALLAGGSEASRAVAAGQVVSATPGAGGTMVAAKAAAEAASSLPGLQPTGPATIPLAAAPVATEAATLAGAEATVLRNPLIDRYLSAHKGVAGATALGPSANFIRSATYEAPAR